MIPLETKFEFLLQLDTEIVNGLKVQSKLNFLEILVENIAPFLRLHWILETLLQISPGKPSARVRPLYPATVLRTAVNFSAK